MNICISFIGDCKSNCSRDMLKIYIYINIDVILFFVISIFMPPDQTIGGILFLFCFYLL